MEISNLSKLKIIFNNYLDILIQYSKYKDFAVECQSIEIVESRKTALTTADFRGIQICVKNLEKERNEIIFVLLHELAHVYTKSSLHDDNFNMILRELVNIAIDNNIYTPQNGYKTFCGKRLQVM
tara:strand:+ start:14197 stop:14571 length:375 start_codon:yes stop_codon:yes gene_type:complete